MIYHGVGPWTPANTSPFPVGHWVCWTAQAGICLMTNRPSSTKGALRNLATVVLPHGYAGCKKGAAAGSSIAARGSFAMVKGGNIGITALIRGIGPTATAAKIIPC